MRHGSNDTCVDETDIYSALGAELFQTLMALILSEMASQLPNDRTASFVRCVSMNIGAHSAGEVSSRDETLHAHEFESLVRIACRQYGGNEQVMFNKCV